jgi:hypothetical protein
MMGTVSKGLERVSKIHAEMPRSEITSLMEIYMSRVTDRGSQSYKGRIDAFEYSGEDPST